MPKLENAQNRETTERFESRSLRRKVLEMAYSGSTVHIACAFSIIEILAVLYRNHLRGLDKPSSPNRDYLVLSKGHGVMAQYACLHELGWLNDDDIKNYFGNGTRLKGLADAHVPGIEVTSGSLGHGLSVGVGLALAAKRNRTEQKVFAIIGDGEANEGTIWEACLFATHWKLDNLIVVVDVNGHQAMGRTEEVMHLHDLRAKFSSFGFEAVDVDGHNERDLNGAFESLKSLNDGRPKAVIAKTVKGHGVSFMADKNEWHYSRLNADLFTLANEELGVPEVMPAATKDVTKAAKGNV